MPRFRKTSKSSSKELEGFDRVFPIVGGHHLYQWLLLLICSIQRGIGVFHHIGYIFLGASPPHWCAVDQLADSTTASSTSNTSWTLEQIKNLSIPLEINASGSPKYSECEYYDLDYKSILENADSRTFDEVYSTVNHTNLNKLQCEKWNFDKSIYESTTVTEFNLVCNRTYLVATIQATYMAGIFTGSLLLGAISDKILGRRRTTLLCVGIIIVFGFGTAFATSYSLFILFRFFIAIGVAGSSQNCFTILMEYSDASIRATLGLITQVAFALGYMIMPLYAYLIRDWSDLQLAFSMTTLTLIVYYWILPESSRWLIQNGRDEEALDILQKIAKTNNRPIPNREELKSILDSCKLQDVKREGTEVESKEDRQSCWTTFKGFLSTYVNLVRTPELRKRSFLIWFLYMSMSFCYYGVSLGSPSLSKDPFLIVFLGGLMEIPGYLAVIPSVTYWGRKPTTITTFSFAGLGYLAIIFTPLEFKAFRICLAMISKLFISGASAIIILLAAELYPTETRNTGLGSAVLFGRVGSITAPYIVTMKFSYEQMSILIIGGISLLAGLVAFLLPETKDAEMLEKVDAIENIARGRLASLRPDEIEGQLEQNGTTLTELQK